MKFTFYGFSKIPRETTYNDNDRYYRIFGINLRLANKAYYCSLYGSLPIINFYAGSRTRKPIC